MWDRHLHRRWWVHCPPRQTLKVPGDRRMVACPPQLRRVMVMGGLQTTSHGWAGEVLVIRLALKSRVVVPGGRRKVAEVLSMSGRQSRVWKVSRVLLVLVQNRKLLWRGHPMPHNLHIQWEGMRDLRRRIGTSPWADCPLKFRTFFIPAAPWSADHRGGKGPALLRRSFKPLLRRRRQLRAVRLLLHCRDRDCQGLGRRRTGRCCCCFPLPKLLLLLHHLPDLFHLLLSLSDHLLLCHLLPQLNPFTPRTSGEQSKDSLVKLKSEFETYEPPNF